MIKSIIEYFKGWHTLINAGGIIFAVKYQLGIAVEGKDFWDITIDKCDLCDEVRYVCGRRSSLENLHPSIVNTCSWGCDHPASIPSEHFKSDSVESIK
ncbi:hypothetical protein ABD91_17165 [Lysinibacillus sphaericus]|uniref:hypothetical protein n=1 Tax=Lysinibacillus sphaericus TaxID=1421 RepID=UPI0018CE1674|nr:hypothetical protein [Lysinibacillus sphaericus]MBG9692529.1 hypothetical protein [Lysinibacillus sphaericus]